MQVGIITFRTLTCLDKFAEARKVKKQMWSFDELGSEVSEEIRKRRRFLQYIRKILTVFTLFGICLCFPMTGDDGEIFVFIDIQSVFGPFRIIFSLTIIFIKVYLMYAVVSADMICLIVTDDIVSYIILLRRKLQSIREIYGEVDDKYYDQSYQKFTNETLKKCISQHVLILK